MQYHNIKMHEWPTWELKCLNTKCLNQSCHQCWETVKTCVSLGILRYIFYHQPSFQGKLRRSFGFLEYFIFFPVHLQCSVAKWNGFRHHCTSRAQTEISYVFKITYFNAHEKEIQMRRIQLHLCSWADLSRRLITKLMHVQPCTCDRIRLRRWRE